MSIQLSSCYSPERSTVPNHTERLDEQDLHIRESWVAAMKARIVRGELIKCQRGEGVNHYKHCRDLAEMYTGMIRENKVSSRRWISGIHRLGERRCQSDEGLARCCLFLSLHIQDRVLRSIYPARTPPESDCKVNNANSFVRSQVKGYKIIDTE
jgi:hypothetical protein